ncbi:Flagella-associated GTP-binding protein [Delftia tsuruhatensis]|uniref:flagellar biosynthesis protein FlhF n=1 Tax=Delftia tsuruhatensis TaxID=180282 RepID=UPI001E808FEF|nr:flagellar biosynthesis protein FlhF [Delftia tsuruhatensis]CAB5698884.1 Flagella-associated GTP-binding protein [Delftia tsuruhatensis]CAC9676494.1 Flagella-associated GTP-binding protein [Delftia tsuruhatensis]
MNIKRFYAPTSREALAKARMAFGAGTLILSNRSTPDGVEVMATAEDTLEHSKAAASGTPLQQAIERRAAEETTGLPSQLQAQLIQAQSRLRAAQPAAARAPQVASQAASLSPEGVEPAGLRQSVQEDTEQLAMSTLSFQDYVRERMLRRRHEAAGEDEPLPSFAQRRSLGDALRETPGAAPQAMPQPKAPAAPSVARHNPLRTGVEAPAREALRAEPAPALGAQALRDELQSMRDLIEERFNTLTWLGQTRQNPIHANLTHKLIRAGYSPVLARALVEHLPQDLSAGDAVRWLMQVLERNLRTDAGQEPLYEQGGVYALVGSTGVGKTTTTAKLAALCAAKYGASSVGLITLDTYRVGAHDQLRSYGRMLGMVAHLAHDRAALQDLLGLLANKQLVLIDTTGVAPRDPRKDEILDLLDLPGVHKLLAVNAAGQGDALDDVMQAFKARGSSQAILTKVDEAVKLGPSVDTLIRHQMQLRGVTNGQRVPEDWERADAQQLVSASMRSASRSAFDPKALDLDFFFTPSSPSTMDSEALHA